MDAHASPAGRRPRISVIILNYNGGHWIDNCLDAVLSEPELDVVVVDNASTDGSAEIVKRRSPAVRLLTLTTNLGFAAGNNRGAAAASGELLAFLNNDTLPAPGWLGALSAPFFEDPSVGLTTAQIVYMDDPNVIDSAGDGYVRAGGAFKRLHGQRVIHPTQRADVFGACGAAFMIRRDLFEALEGFDEDFFMVYEDVDLSFRARLLGYRCVYVPEAVVRHAGSGTLGRVSSRAVYYGQRNLEWTYVKNMPAGLLLRSLPAHLLYVAAAGIRYAFHGQFHSYASGKWDALKAVREVLRKRRVVQRSRRSSTRSLWDAMHSGWIGVKRLEKRFDLAHGRKGRASV